MERHIRELVEKNFDKGQFEAVTRNETPEEKAKTAEAFKWYAEKIRSAIKPIC